ncbi:MAG TPA: aldehyde:ferredoxin oxidoreductase [Chloroflexi bacterium]|nr:aldehyde:ferredoxin oxidoreductase [Chloroflexota bacterium]
MPHGYNGKILHVHLDSLTLETETPPESFYRELMGGSAMGATYLLQNTPANADPLGPENTLTLMLGVTTGAPVSGQSRLTATAKSPLTEAVGDSQCGGFFPAELKFAGFDGIVVHGAAEKPVYLWIKDGEAELRPAEHLWGKTTGEVDDILQAELGDKRIQVMQTGIAGENGVRYAAILNMSNRANGRTGMGAVMGAKKLKAIAVRGKQRPDLFDKKGLNELARWGSGNFEDSDVYGLGLLGTAEVLSYQQSSGGLPTRNWASGSFEGWEAIDGKTMAKTILKERDTCYACTVRCKRVVEAEAPYKVDPRYGGPEYETLATFGSYCGIDNLEAVAYANQLCNLYGVDTISCGATIAWAMEAFEAGLLTTEDTGGLELRFGDHEMMTRLVEMIAHREGFGALLAEGSARVAEKIGRGTEDYLVTAKKQEYPAHMPQVKRSLALIYAVNPFGADHQSSEHDPSYDGYPERMAQLGLTDPQPADNLNAEKVKYAYTTQCLYSAMDSVNVCQFVYGPAWHLYDAEQLAQMISLVTGWEVSVAELLKVGERRLNLLRAFNAREGLGRNEDKLPMKMYQALKGGASDGVALSEAEFEAALDLYYELAGWDVKTGMPTKEKLENLGFSWLAEVF